MANNALTKAFQTDIFFAMMHSVSLQPADAGFFAFTVHRIPYDERWWSCLEPLQSGGYNADCSFCPVIRAFLFVQRHLNSIGAVPQAFVGRTSTESCGLGRPFEVHFQTRS